MEFCLCTVVPPPEILGSPLHTHIYIATVVAAIMITTEVAACHHRCQC